MINHVGFAFAILCGIVHCVLWQRVNYPNAIEMEYIETSTQNSLTSCVFFCAGREDTLAVSYQMKNCFCLIHDSSSVGSVNVSFIFLKYHDYVNCFGTGYDIIYPHLEFCIKFNSAEVKWTTANQTCIDDGAGLMTLETDAKCNIASNLPTNKFARRIHVGGSNNGTHFVWSTGDEILSCWGEKEPTNEPDQKCVSVLTSGNIYLHDISCSSAVFAFLCEKSAKVIP